MLLPILVGQAGARLGGAFFRALALDDTGSPQEYFYVGDADGDPPRARCVLVDNDTRAAGVFRSACGSAARLDARAAVVVDSKVPGGVHACPPPALARRVLAAIRVLLREHTDADTTSRFEGFLLVHGAAGGIGSGVAATLIPALVDAYPTARLLVHAALPGDTAEGGVAALNTVLSVAHVHAGGDAAGVAVSALTDTLGAVAARSGAPAVARVSHADLARHTGDALAGVLGPLDATHPQDLPRVLSQVFPLPARPYAELFGARHGGRAPAPGGGAAAWRWLARALARDGTRGRWRGVPLACDLSLAVARGKGAAAATRERAPGVSSYVRVSAASKGHRAAPAAADREDDSVDVPLLLLRSVARPSAASASYNPFTLDVIAARRGVGRTEGRALSLLANRASVGVRLGEWTERAAGHVAVGAYTFRFAQRGIEADELAWALDTARDVIDAYAETTRGEE